LIAYLGFGSNLGDRTSNIERAYTLLEKSNIRILKKSHFYETKPYGVTNQPEFVNSVALVETEFGPFKLLETIKKIEKDIGRKETYRWGPRVIDIDILFYEDFILKSQTLTIPHPDLHNRCFVLIPLCELDCELVHPVLRQKISKILESLICNDVERIEVR